MPEYLAPGVYVEEIEIGAKPIEGVSTSTAGFLGMTERGPLNKPTLVTSFAEYQRIFGGYLPEKNPDYGNKRFLPYAVQGFFENGGKRVYITRVATEKAKKSLVKLPERSNALTTTLNSSVNAGTDAIPLADLDNLVERPILKIKDGAATEYVEVVIEDGNLIKDENNNPKITSPLKYSHVSGTEVEKLKPTIQVEAATEGTWGDRIKIVIKESSISKAKLTEEASNQNFLELDTVTGMEKGTLLKLPTEPTSYATITEVIKSDDIKQVVLDKKEVTISKGQEVLTAEFDLIVNFDGFSETFKNLSMNKDHSRYIEKIITEETSQLIRVKDVSITVDPSQRIPMPTQDKEPGWKLSGGDDGIPTDNELNTIYEGKDDPEPQKRTGLYTLKNIDEISIVAIPGITTQHMQNKLIIHCETMKDRFAVLDSIEKADLDKIQTQRNLYDSKYAALYYPWIRVFDPLTKKRINVPPSGHICGIYARNDVGRGVHKAPANEIVKGALGLEEFNGIKRVITKGQQDILNPRGVNCIRAFPGRGIRVWGARTTSSDPLWKYINVRRLFLFLEESIEEGTQWVVFEPNDEKLWARVKQSITNFLTKVWKDGALMGTTPEEAFFVKCDSTTMTENDIANGRLICIIGVAPVKPAEFVIFRIAQWAGGSEISE